MSKSRQILVPALLMIATAGLGACGLGLIDFGGGGDHKGVVVVKGNIDRVLPVTARDIVVFVFAGDDPEESECPATSTTTSTSTSTTVASLADAAAAANAGGELAADASSCECPAAPVHPECTPGKSVVLTSGEKNFTLDRIDSGMIRVVFLLDNAGSSADGQIDPGDPIAVLDDIDCQLDDVNAKTTVTLTDVDLRFASAPESECQDGVDDPPAAGRARALSITKATTPDE